MKSKILKCLAIASTLALFNCGSDSVSNAINDTKNDLQESAAADSLQQSSSSIEEFSSSSITDPAESSSSIFTASTGPTSSSSIASDIPAADNPESAPSSSSIAENPGPTQDQESSSSVTTDVVKKASIFLSEGSDENKDQLEIERMENVGPDGNGILAYPKNMSTDPNVKHAVVIWGPGGGEKPNAYNGMINRLASHGFVVFALSSSPGTADNAIAALNWLEEKNNLDYGVLSHKLDMTKVGCSGHSMGGLESEQALIKDERVITAMLNNSGAMNHAEAANVATDKTIGLVYGEGGMERPNAEGDYNNSNVKAPACLLKMSGGTGSECNSGECGWGHGSGPWGGMAATVSWMRWHLGGEDFRKSDFVGSSGAYINGPIVNEQGSWKGQCKNF